jgi:hypothetical protein
MMQTLCLVWGVLAMVGMVIFLIPCLGLLNYVVVGVVTLAISKASNKVPTIAGLACCGIAIVVGVLRLA